LTKTKISDTTFQQLNFIGKRKGGMVIMKIVPECFVLIVILFILPATLSLAQQGDSLSVDISGKDTDFTRGTPMNPGFLTSITPGAAKQGQVLTVTITGYRTHFGQATWAGGDEFHQCTSTQGTSTTIASVRLSQGSSTIYWVRGWPLYDTLFYALFDIPEDANPGKWDVNVDFVQCSPTVHHDLVIPEGFTVAQPGDITCDGAVNFFDLAVLANNWLKGAEE
jgi:hypothetical protein